MDPEAKRLLEETRAFAKDNHDMLRAIRRHQWYSFFWTVIVWVVVLALPFYLYQQYLGPLVEKFSTVSGATTSDNSTITEIQKLLNSFQRK
ncbi:hypothetical protein HY415_00555 [Candidatus Kaiserbacteria bacterium]|nr:hypothetical protein [Candidatus Kaiserbacteria bacterium]